MAEGHDLVISAAMTDNIRFPDGRRMDGVVGGGLHALAGTALWSEQAVFVSGVGADAETLFHPWFRRNDLSLRGLRLMAGPSLLNLVTYASDDERTERQLHGPQSLVDAGATVADVAASLAGARSAYVFGRTGDAVLHYLMEQRRETGLLVLWEVALDTVTPKNRPNVLAAIAQLDAVSLNLAEARLLFGEEDETVLLATLAALGAPVIFLRVGSRGSYAIADGRAVFVPSLLVEAIDVTGGGNAYSGAAVAALANGLSPAEAAMCGTIAAAYTVVQFGTFEPSEIKRSGEAEARLNQLRAATAALQSTL